MAAMPQLTSQNNEIIRVFKQSIKDDFAMPVAAMYSLINVIRLSKATTLMELGNELNGAVNCLKTCTSEDLEGKSRIPLISGCDLFMKYVTKAFQLQQSKDFRDCKSEILKRGERYASMSMSSRKRIASLGHSFIEDGFTVLIHGDSRVVYNLIMAASERNNNNNTSSQSLMVDDNMDFYTDMSSSPQFNLIITEGSPDCKGNDIAKKYIQAGIPTRVIPDTAVATLFDRIDMCLSGAEGVMENGGIVNKVGTYQIAILAKTFKKPFYVAVESYKFSRLYPLSQRDFHDMNYMHETNTTNATTTVTAYKSLSDSSHSSPTRNSRPMSHRVTATVNVDISKEKNNNDCLIPKVDFTPSEYITLLFTDLGVLTPAAVSDELIRLYQ